MDHNENKPTRRGSRIARLGTALGLMLSAMLALCSGAFATTTDDTGTSSLFDGAKSALTGTLIPAVVSIVLVGSLFWLAVRWYQKGKNAGNR